MTRLTGPMLHASLAAFKISVKDVMLGESANTTR
jgi:hypothetical protein